MKTIQEYLLDNADRFISELKFFLSIPSISAIPDHKNDIEAAADFLVNALNNAGAANTKKYYTGGNPIVYGERITDPELPTVLIYGHYDVQPADPVELWHSPPFNPIIKEGKIIARGASDDKSQVYLVIKAIETLNYFRFETCNIKVIFEGEEETGSSSLPAFLEEHKKMLAADSVLICDTAMPAKGCPAIITSMRGISYCEIKITGAPHDLHSGIYGGAVVNPLQVLCNLLSKLKDHENKITIPGFYDGIKENVVNKNKTELNLEGLNKHLCGEKGYSPADQICCRPSLDINGIHGGYTGSGPKTIIPAEVTAKVSMRLAEGQDYKTITQHFTNYLNFLTPDQVQLSVKFIAGCNAVKINENSEAFKTAENALYAIFRKEPVLKQMGGSIPVVSMIHDLLKAEPIMMGFSLDEDNIHGPDESFLLDNFFKGIETIIEFSREFSFQNVNI